MSHATLPTLSHGTNISQNGHQEDFHDFIIMELTRLLLEVPTRH